MFCRHVFLCTMCTQCPWRPEGGISSPGTGVTDVFKAWKHWESIPGPPVEPSVSLTTEPSLYSPRWPLA
ncbi:mCG1050916 [Mus musculus]|nr:mCG1050916 [Mus musculus]